MMQINDSLSPFDNFAPEYDQWFERNPGIFQAEVEALQKAIPPQKEGIDIGAGTGRFAEALGVRQGVEPSENMARLAEERAIRVIRGSAEDLPLDDESFDYALMINTVCFLDDIPKAFGEARRILKARGSLIIAIIDKNNWLGKKYEAAQASHKFYSQARFHTPEEITGLLSAAGFHDFEYWQTLSSDVERQFATENGFGRGGFVVIKAEKTEINS